MTRSPDSDAAYVLARFRAALRAHPAPPLPCVTREPELVEGGQGRTAASVVASSRVAGWCLLGLLVVIALAYVFASK